MKKTGWPVIFQIFLLCLIQRGKCCWHIQSVLPLSRTFFEKHKYIVKRLPP